MLAADAQLLQIFADPKAVELARRLLRGPAKQRELAEQLGMTPATVSRYIARLSQEGLAQRVGERGPYQLTHPDGTRALLKAAADLASFLATAKALRAEQRAAELEVEDEVLEQPGGSA